MRLAILAVLASLLCSTLAVPVQYKSCGSGHMTIDSIDATSWPPAKGAVDALNVTGSLDSDITDGSYKISIKVDGFPLPAESGSISTFKPLPWSKGAFAFIYSPDIPSVAPSGGYSIQLSAVDQANTQILCIDLAFKLKSDDESDDMKSEKRSPVKRLMDRVRLAKSVMLPMIDEAPIADEQTAEIIQRHVRTKYSHAKTNKIEV